MKKISLRKSFNTKYVKIGGSSAIFCAIAIAIAVVVNLIINQLPTTVTKLDTSRLRLYDITDATKEIVRGIDDDVTIYLIAETGREDEVTLEFVKRYAALNSRLSVKTVDPAIQPAFTSKYTDDALSPSSLIVENKSNSRFRVIDSADIYVKNYSEQELYNYYYYGITPTGTTSFAAENVLTSAMDYVTTDKLPVVYKVTGHGETTLGTGVTEYIGNENIDLRELALLTEEAVPDDANMVIINAPTKDYTEEEITKLNNYINAGGNVVLLTSYGDNTVPDNIRGFAESMGLVFVDGLVIEGSSGNYYNYVNWLLPNITSNTFSSKIDSGTNIVMRNCHGIKAADTPDSSVTVSSLLSTSSGSYAKVNPDEAESAEKEEGDIDGPLYVGAMSEKKVDDATTGRLVWFSSTDIVSDDTARSFSNIAYFISMTTNLCEKEESISIASKSMAVESLQISEGGANLWGAVIIGLIPLAFLIYGFVLWNNRRKQ